MQKLVEAEIKDRHTNTRKSNKSRSTVDLHST